MRPMIADELGFKIRQRARWSAPAFKRTVSRDAFALGLDAPARARFEALAGRCDLSRWPSTCTMTEWHESLYVLDVVTRHVPTVPAGRRLDVGSKTAAYLPGLVAAHGPAWDLVEVDAHRRYLWGSTRRVYGERMARAFHDCRYVAGDLRTLEGPWSFVTWFLPFVSRGAHRAWGLPDSLFVPEALLRHVRDRVIPGGVLFIVNQGEHERDLQRALFASQQMEPIEIGPLTSDVSPFRRPRYGWVWRAPALSLSP